MRGEEMVVVVVVVRLELLAGHFFLLERVPFNWSEH